MTVEYDQIQRCACSTRCPEWAPWCTGMCKLADDDASQLRTGHRITHLGGGLCGSDRGLRIDEYVNNGNGVVEMRAGGGDGVNAVSSWSGAPDQRASTSRPRTAACSACANAEAPGNATGYRLHSGGEVRCGVGSPYCSETRVGRSPARQPLGELCSEAGRGRAEGGLIGFNNREIKRNIKGATTVPSLGVRYRREHPQRVGLRVEDVGVKADELRL